MPWYFAYGSNNIKQLKARLNKSELIAYPGIVEGYSRRYVGYADKWDSSVATIIKNPTSVVLGSFIYLSKKDFDVLDTYEFVYYKRKVRGTLLRARCISRIKALAYIYDLSNRKKNNDARTNDKYLRACYENVKNMWNVGSFNNWKIKENVIN